MVRVEESCYILNMFAYIANIRYGRKRPKYSL